MDQQDKTKLRDAMNRLMEMLLPLAAKALGNRFSIATLAGVAAGLVDLLVAATETLNGNGEAIVMGSIVGIATLVATRAKST